jgi:hypothetical protein
MSREMSLAIPHATNVKTHAQNSAVPARSQFWASSSYMTAPQKNPAAPDKINARQIGFCSVAELGTEGCEVIA